jgi:FKBP-type peptidyl-prolyl cis-trans isomerase
LVRDLEIGSGPIVRRGDRVEIYYFGVNYETDKPMYYRWLPEPILEIRVGNAAWEKSLLGMRPGGLRESIIPSRLHLGTGTVDFLFKMVRVDGRTTTRDEDGYPVPRAVPGEKPLERLVAKDLEVGEGPMAQWGDETIARYVGVSYKTGEIFSQHWGDPLNFRLDGKTFGLGWQKGIHGMRVGAGENS